MLNIGTIKLFIQFRLLFKYDENVQIRGRNLIASETVLHWKY